MHYATKAEFELLKQRYADLVGDPDTCDTFADAPIIDLIKQMNNENLVTVFSCASHPEKQLDPEFVDDDLRWHIIMAVRNIDGYMRARKYFGLMQMYTFGHATSVWKECRDQAIVHLSMNHGMLVLPMGNFDRWYNCITIEGRSPSLEYASMHESVRWRDGLFKDALDRVPQT